MLTADTQSPEIAEQPRQGFWPQVYFGVAATSMATLLLELALTRVFSVVYFYHFAFLAISVALFGLGAGGVVSYLVSGLRGSLYGKLGTLAVADAIALVFCLWFLLSRSSTEGAGLAIAYFVTAIPFLIAGTILSLVVADTIAQVNRVYFFDLIGAAGGCAVLVLLLRWIGGPNTILVAAVLYAVSGAIWFHLARASRGRIFAVVVALLLVGLITYNYKSLLIDVKYAKGQQLKDEEFVRWNEFSRIALKPEPGSGFKSIVIDADAATGVAPFDFAHLTAHQKFELAYAGPGMPYLLRPGAKTLIIGPGGGWDVSRALASGSKDITGVEINPIIANVIMRQQFPQYSNYLYLHHPEVKIVVEDGRSFIRRSHDRYQVLQATLVDTWASTAAGAFALSENNLYTTNAFVDYLTHLTDDGVMAFTRWGFVPPRESLRVVALAYAALKQLGESDPASHIAVVRENSAELQRWGAKDTILIARRPFSPDDLSRLQTAVATAKMQLIYLPGTDLPSRFRDLLLSPDVNRFYATYRFDVRPVSDNRPFFFYTVQPRDLWRFMFHASHDTADYKVNSALPVLFQLIGISLVAMVVILSLPPVLLGHRLPREDGILRALLFFLCIGVGYILIQVALIQKFVLFLGHPTYALTVIIFSMLLSSGFGSYVSKSLLRSKPRRLAQVLLLVVAAVLLLSFVVTPITEGGVALFFPLKILISVLLISPMGFAMGMPFPTGLGLLEEISPKSVRWAWAINAASSVLGSAAAIFLAIYLGLQLTLVIGGLLYAGAWLSLTYSPLRNATRTS